MGYVARTVDAEGVKKTLTECVPICDVPRWDTVSTTDEVLYKLTVDLTDVDYLNFSYHIYSTAQATTLTIYFGVVSKHSDNVTGADKHVDGSIDCTAISGDQVISVAIKMGAGGAGNKITDLRLWSMES